MDEEKNQENAKERFAYAIDNGVAMSGQADDKRDNCHS